ncbi:hypothetical protein GCM10022403_078050 [Streptomyces coacervatus]|uniref:Uncharacterized protein n=1 Tax=Streptomyces coacervatus TaxID=647381 RepID=A0ABP7J310_9ACTN
MLKQAPGEILRCGVADEFPPEGAASCRIVVGGGRVERGCNRGSWGTVQAAHSAECGGLGGRSGLGRGGGIMEEGRFGGDAGLPLAGRAARRRCRAAEREPAVLVR